MNAFEQFGVAVGIVERNAGIRAFFHGQGNGESAAETIIKRSLYTSRGSIKFVFVTCAQGKFFPEAEFKAATHLVAGEGIGSKIQHHRDAADIAGATSDDANSNGIPDECDACVFDTDCDDDVFCNGAESCNVDTCTNGMIPCELGQLCDEEFDLCQPDGSDCNTNGVGDAYDIALGTSADLNSNGVPDECDACVMDADCDDGLYCTGIETCNIDTCAPSSNPCLIGQTCVEESDTCAPTGADCNANGIGDATDIAAGTSMDCNSNGVPDACDIAFGDSNDCNLNAVPDDCDLLFGDAFDCNTNGALDECDIAE